MKKENWEKDFDNKFGGEQNWLGADRKVVKDFICQILSQEEKKYLIKFDKWCREQCEGRKDESWRRGYQGGYEEAIKEVLEIINHSIDKTDAFGEISEKIK